MPRKTHLASLGPRLADLARPRASVAGWREHDRVALTAAIETSTATLPAGSTGTIVNVWVPGQAFEVEFVKPFAALVTVQRDQLTKDRSRAGMR